jgi:polyisoprenoid-binding protein YceI
VNSVVKRVAIALVALLALGVGGAWVYINVIKEDAPERLSLDDAAGATGSTTTTAGGELGEAPAGSSLDGTWKIAEGSEVGYRVKEVLFGQSTEGVGRTSKVTGTFTLAGTSVSEADFSVDMASVTSDETRRDGQFRDRIMSTGEFPKATFTLTSPIRLSAMPADGAKVTAVAKGDLTLRGTTKPVEIDLEATLDGDSVNVLGNYTVVFEDWDIPNPSIGPVSTDDHGLLELLLVLDKS